MTSALESIRLSDKVSIVSPANQIQQAVVAGRFRMPFDPYALCFDAATAVQRPSPADSAARTGSGDDGLTRLVESQERTLASVGYDEARQQRRALKRKASEAAQTGRVCHAMLRTYAAAVERPSPSKRYARVCHTPLATTTTIAAVFRSLRGVPLRLELVDCGLDSAALYILYEHLIQHNESPVHLDLSDNPLGPESASILRYILVLPSVRSRLHTLVLRNTALDSPAAASVIATVVDRCALAVLDLSDNPAVLPATLLCSKLASFGVVGTKLDEALPCHAPDGITPSHDKQPKSKTQMCILGVGHDPAPWESLGWWWVSFSADDPPDQVDPRALWVSVSQTAHNHPHETPAAFPVGLIGSATLSPRDRPFGVGLGSETKSVQGKQPNGKQKFQPAPQKPVADRGVAAAKAPHPKDEL